MKQSALMHEHGIRAAAIDDLDRKKEMVLDALRNSGVDRDELAAVTVLALIDRTPDEVTGEVVPPVDGRYVTVMRRNIDRGIELNVAATAMVGAAL